jgi:PKD repeat protein
MLPQMNKLLLLLFFHCFFITSRANHLVGGDLYYVYKEMSLNGKPLYKVTLRFFRNMEASVPSIQNEPVYIGIYENNNLLSTITLRFEKVDTVKSTSFPACVNNSLQTIYEVGYFSADAEMPSASPNYTLAWIRCCRTNLVDNMNLVEGGIMLTAFIPRTGLVGNQPNNSAIFPLKDTVLLCNNQYFSLDFAAEDADNDSLSYLFYPALDGASLSDPAPQPNSSIVIKPLAYKAPQFSATAPLGAGVSLNPATGQISGTAPSAGTYLVTARVFEWRNGILINEHSKDILIRVKNCSYSQALLKPVYLLCDSSTISLANELQGAPTDTWFWDFGVPGLDSDTSRLANPQYTYPQPGTYTVTLTVNKDKPCPATATAQVDAYPGLKSGFMLPDSCVGTPIGFTDTSRYDLGTVNQWNWDFGEPQAGGNTSQQQNPVHTYISSGLKTVRLITGSDKGCTDTSYRKIQVLPLPALSLAQHSLTICRGDSVQLAAAGNGSFSWTPNESLSHPQSATPFAIPSQTATYSVTLTDDGCSARDSVTVTLLPRDTIYIQPVPPLCKGDTVQLQAYSAAAAVQWNASAYLSDANSLTPLTAPVQDTW